MYNCRIEMILWLRPVRQAWDEKIAELLKIFPYSFLYAI